MGGTRRLGDTSTENGEASGSNFFGIHMESGNLLDFGSVQVSILKCC